MSRSVLYKTPEQIWYIKEAWKYLTQLLMLIHEAAKPGVILMELEAHAERFISMHGLKWSFKWFNWFPANLCLSVNDCVVHWIPDETILQEGDLLKIDAGITYKWWIADSAISLIVWWNQHNKQWFELIKATKQSLDNWILNVKPWESMFNYAKTVESTMKKAWFSIIKDLTGHWVGINVHEAPSIYNRPAKIMKKQLFKPWMVVAFEPITAIKSSAYAHWQKNDRNLYTDRWDLWAQREYTVVIHQENIEILAWVQENLR